MTSDKFTLSPSGVLIATDFRENLLIDRYDPVFSSMRAGKIKHLQSANSEDAVIWNVFRSLRQISPDAWLPALWQQAFPSIAFSPAERTEVNLWQNITPPPPLLADGDEGPSEIDVIIETPTYVWFIEAKYRSDISARTKTRPDRDQVLRNIDVGSYYAGVRQFLFSLLIASKSRSPEGAERVRQYSDPAIPRARLEKHRQDALKNLIAISQITWRSLADVLEHAAKSASREDERAYAVRAVNWLTERGILKTS